MKMVKMGLKNVQKNCFGLHKTDQLISLISFADHLVADLHKLAELLMINSLHPYGGMEKNLRLSVIDPVCVKSRTVCIVR